jgi:hypothetical protein
MASSLLSNLRKSVLPVVAVGKADLAGAAESARLQVGAAAGKQCGELNCERCEQRNATILPVVMMISSCGASAPGSLRRRSCY